MWRLKADNHMGYLVVVRITTLSLVTIRASRYTARVRIVLGMTINCLLLSWLI